MSTTDNAFIKVYQRDPVGNVVGPTRNDRQSPAGNSAEAEGAGTAAGQTDGRNPLLRGPHAWSNDGTKPTGRPSTGLRKPLTSNTWQDAAHVGPSAPHVTVQSFKNGPAVQSLQQSPPPRSTTTESKFIAGWEVDRFSWPAICNELQEHWVGPLTSIVRSIVRQAWQGGNVVAVTQATRSEGASTLALCLSRIAASFQIPVALVDGHHQNPQIASLLKLQFEDGWDETSPTFPLEESAINSIDDGLIVLPLRAAPKDSEWNIAASLRAQVVEQLSSSFELVVIDMGPMYVAAHNWFQQPLTQHVGCAMVLRDIRVTETPQTNDVCHRIRSAGIQNISIVENFQIA